MSFPWQQDQWKQLHNQLSEGRLPHALLLTGANGLGKLQFGQQFAASLLCKSVMADGHACGQCDACKLLAAGTHPDYLYLEPEEDLKAIKIDDIRELCASLSMTAQFGGYKVAVIALADNMNINASNSLLKTLEEPTGNTVLILVTSRPHRLPVTIRSRCQTIAFQLPDQAMAEQWLEEQKLADAALLLKIAHGAPLLACALGETDLVDQRKDLISALLAISNSQPVTEQAAILSKAPVEKLLGWLYDWISDLLKLHQCGPQAALINSDFRGELSRMVTQSDQQGLFRYLDEVIKLRQVQSIPLNTQMLWEDLLISWDKQLKRV